ncbi:hypothetical protein BX592_14435, partial [Paraburkholderia rhizosphaerae]
SASAIRVCRSRSQLRTAVASKVESVIRSRCAACDPGRGGLFVKRKNAEHTTLMPRKPGTQCAGVGHRGDSGLRCPIIAKSVLTGAPTIAYRRRLPDSARRPATCTSTWLTAVTGRCMPIACPRSVHRKSERSLAPAGRSGAHHLGRKRRPRRAAARRVYADNVFLCDPARRRPDTASVLTHG